VSSAQYAGFRLAFAGLTLFLFGLGLGFSVTLFPTIKPLLSAHESALGSGTFLIGIGAIWSIYMKSESRILVLGIWLSHYALSAALVFSGLGGTTRKVAIPLIAISCVAVALTTFISLSKFWRETRPLRPGSMSPAETQ
jgi:hypothetical protein